MDHMMEDVVVSVYMLISLFKGVGFFVLTHLMLASVLNQHSLFYCRAAKTAFFILPPTYIHHN